MCPNFVEMSTLSMLQIFAFDFPMETLYQIFFNVTYEMCLSNKEMVNSKR